jgi:hypothetical protein
VADWLRAQGYDTRAVVSLATMNPLAEDRGLDRGFAYYDVDYWLISRGEDAVRRMDLCLAKRDVGAPLFFFAHFSDPHEPYHAHGLMTLRVSLSRDGVPIDEILATEWGQWSAELELAPGRTVFEFTSQGEPSQSFQVRSFTCSDEGKNLPVTWDKGSAMERLRSARIVVDRGVRQAATCRLRTWVTDAPRKVDLSSRYKVEVEYVDQHVGAVLRRLEELGLYQDSLVILTSDHGEALGERNHYGHIEHLTDEMLRVPLLIKLPRTDPRRAGLELSAAGVVSHIDLIPTLLDLAGLPPLPGQRGMSLLLPHESVHIAETHRPQAKRNQIALLDAQYKMIYFADEKRFELYALADDPGEQRDVFATQSGLRDQWPQQLVALFAQSTASAASGGEPDEVDPDLLKALGYGGGEE